MAESRDRLLSGRYRLMYELGRGGMGTVWWAYDEVDGREVAVKEVHLPPSLRPRERLNLIKRTNREAMSAGRLHHPNLITMYDVVVEDDRPWLVMEYVPARSLEDVFVEDGPISPARVADIGRQLLDALRAAHHAGIVHRDVKPSNVLLETSGRVVLTDFGIATYEGATTLTQSGTFMGSPAYVAPEVARGERATPASDLWSLGATLYAAVEGRPPYDFETAMATLSALVTTEPDPPERAGPLRPLLDGLLRKEPHRRLSPDRAAALLAAAAAPPRPPRPPEMSRARSTRRSSHEWSSRDLPGLRRPGRTGPGRPAPGGPGRPDRGPSGRRPPFPEQPGYGWLDAAGSGPSGDGRRRILDRPGMLPLVTGGVLALAVAAGVLVGRGGWVGPRGDASSVDRTPGTPSAAARSTPPRAGSPSSRPVPDALPSTLPNAAGGPRPRRVTKKDATWPDTPGLTLTVPGRDRGVDVTVVCRSGADGLSFTAYALGAPDRTVKGDCAGPGRRAATPPALRLAAGVAHARIRVRFHAGPRAPGGPIEWLIGVYEAMTP